MKGLFKGNDFMLLKRSKLWRLEISSIFIPSSFIDKCVHFESSSEI